MATTTTTVTSWRQCVHVCWLFLGFIALVLSETKFSWNPGNSANPVMYTPDCGLSSVIDFWTVENGFLTVDDTDQWDDRVFITAKTQVCVIDLTRCHPVMVGTEECFCTGKIGNTFTLKIKQRASQANSEGEVKASLNPAQGVNAKPVVSAIGMLPVIYDPLTFHLTVNSDPHMTLTADRRTEVVTPTNKTTLKFCARNILPGSKLVVLVDGEETQATGGECVTVNVKVAAHRTYQLSFGYNEVNGCKRYGVVKGSIRLKDDGPLAEENTQFDNLETIYGVMLGAMAAIFVTACVLAWLWYYRTKRNMKHIREQELQGTLDFDKFDTRIEDSTI